MKEYRKEEKELFEKMKKELSGNNISGFAEDGIVDPQSWDEAKVKCLFLLKEPVGNPCKSFSLTSFVQDGAQKASDRTWRNVARWMYSISHIDALHHPYYKEIKAIGNSVEQRKKYLKNIAIINLKKQPGESVTKTKKLKEEFKKHYAKWLPQQLRIYDNANVIICCGKGVMECLMSVFADVFDEPYNDANWHMYKYTGGYKAEIPYYQLQSGLIIIDYYHPSALISDEKKNNVFKNMIKELVLSSEH